MTTINVNSINHNLHYSVLRPTHFYQQHNCFLFLFTLFVDFSFSILVDINRLVRIVQFMYTVFSVWVPEVILFYLFINFYGDNYILSAAYLLALMNLNLDKLVKVY